MERFAMSPPVARVQACFNGDIRKQDVLNGTPVPRKNTHAAVGAVNHQILKHAIPDTVIAIAHSNAAGTALQRAIVDSDILCDAFLLAKTRYTNGIVTRTDIAVRDVNITAGGAMNAIIVGIRQPVENHNSDKVDVIAVRQMKGPQWAVLNRNVADQNIFAVGQDDQVPRTILGQYRSITHVRIPVHIFLALPGKLAVEVILNPALVQIHELSPVAVNHTMPCDGNVSGILGEDEAMSLLSIHRVI